METLRMLEFEQFKGQWLLSNKHRSTPLSEWLSVTMRYIK